jgi:hypothetical protein
MHEFVYGNFQAVGRTEPVILGRFRKISGGFPSLVADHSTQSQQGRSPRDTLKVDAIMTACDIAYVFFSIFNSGSAPEFEFGPAAFF